MPSLIEFPQRQHQEFRNFGYKTIAESSKIQKLSIEDYIGAIYYSGEKPELLSIKSEMLETYKRFQNLIDSTVDLIPNSKYLEPTDKVYICFRIYLQMICTDNKLFADLDFESYPEGYLESALNAFFSEKQKVLRTDKKQEIIKYLKVIRDLPTDRQNPQ